MTMSAKRAARRALFSTLAKHSEHAKENAEKQSRLERLQFRGGHQRTRFASKPSRPQSGGPTPEYLHWRESVLLRDGYKCVFCGCGDDLEADHIKPRSIYPEFQYDIDNGRTLCWPCHSKTETYGTKVAKIISVSIEN
jgi:5-methylcytosine-specific restriction endonuclease McrA